MAGHEGLVRWVVRRQWLAGLPFEDALHEGRIGLWSALRHYDPQRGTAFSSYAVPAIARAVWRAVSVHARLSSPIQALPASPQPSDALEQIYRAEVDATLFDLVKRLPARLQEVVVRHYGLGDCPPQTFAAIGGTLGVSRQRVQQLHVAAMLWLAHPAHCLSLRRLLDRHRRADYQRAMARQRKIARRQRRPSPAVGRRQTRRRVAP